MKYRSASRRRKPDRPPFNTSSRPCHDIPTPIDARHIAIQDSRWIMTCEIPRDLPSAADNYLKAMGEIGFTPRPHEPPSGKSASLSFESAGHDVVLVTLTAAVNHATMVKLEGYSASFLEAMKKAAAEAKIKHDAQERDQAKAAAKAKAEMIKASTTRLPRSKMRSSTKRSGRPKREQPGRRNRSTNETTYLATMPASRSARRTNRDTSPNSGNSAICGASRTSHSFL